MPDDSVTQINDITMNRLVYIKQLYELGVQQSYRLDISAANSILIFHDAIEMFLFLIYELRVSQPKSSKDSPSFLAYWKELNPKEIPNGVALPFLTQMSRFNDTRTNLKHKTVVPSHEMITEFRYSSQLFLDEVMQIVFGMSFSSISMTNLITNHAIRISLQNAELQYKQNEVGQAADNIAVALELAKIDYIRRKSELLSWHERHDIPELSYRSINTQDFDYSQRTALDSLDDFAKEAVKVVNIMGQVVSSMQLGVDYLAQEKFSRIMPYVSVTFGGVFAERHEQYILPTEEDFQFCYNFALQTALHLQNLDPIRGDEIANSIEP